MKKEASSCKCISSFPERSTLNNIVIMRFEVSRRTIFTKDLSLAIIIITAQHILFGSNIVGEIMASVSGSVTNDIDGNHRHSSAPHIWLERGEREV